MKQPWEETTEIILQRETESTNTEFFCRNKRPVPHLPSPPVFYVMLVSSGLLIAHCVSEENATVPPSCLGFKRQSLRASAI